MEKNSSFKKRALIFGLSASKKLAASMSKSSKIPLGKINITQFLDEEILIDVKSHVRNKSVFLVQSTSKPGAQHLLELLLTVDAIRRASVKEITVIMPYFGYSRQDRRGKGRQPISASLIANLLETAGIDRVITFDLHATQIEGFFKIPIDNLKASGILLNQFKKNYKGKVSDLIVVSPDHGGITRAREIALILKTKIAIIDKKRDKPNSIESMYILGDVKNKTVIIVDDILDTGGTIQAATNMLYKKGAKDVHVVVTHALLSGTKENPKKAIEMLQKAKVTSVISTNSIEKKDKLPSFIIKVDLAKALGDVVVAHLSNKSITNYFMKKYSVQL